MGGITTGGEEYQETDEERHRRYKAIHQRLVNKIRTQSNQGHFWEMYCDLCGNTQDHAGEFKTDFRWTLCEKCLDEVFPD